MRKATHILLLLPVIAGMLLGDARLSVGCNAERQAADQDIATSGAASTPDNAASCCAISPAAAVKSKSCCATETTPSYEAASSYEADSNGGTSLDTSGDCCCRSGAKTSCGCQCGQTGDDRVPANRAPTQAPQTLAKKLPAVGSALELLNDSRITQPQHAVFPLASLSGATRSILYCCWRN